MSKQWAGLKTDWSGSATKYLVWLNPSYYDLDDPAKKESVQQKVNEIMNDYEKKK